MLLPMGSAIAIAALAAIINVADPDASKIALDLFNKALVADQAHNYGLSIELLKKSSELGYPQAQIFLGLLYTKGDGIPKDPSEGTKWLRRAADQGDNAAQFYVAMQY